MEHAECEVRVLNININDIKTKLESLGAKNKGEYFQRRFVYDFNPVNPNSWIRLRTNGVETTLTIKNVVSKDKIDGTKELEVVVGDFDTTNEILNRLGYVARNYQENKRISYDLNGVEIDIDSWPLIDDYMEIEGKSVSEVEDTLKKLDIDNEKVTTLDVASIYHDIYNIDVLKIRELRFDESLLEYNESL